MFNKLSFPKMFDFLMTRKYFCTALDRYIPGKKNCGAAERYEDH